MEVIHETLQEPGYRGLVGWRGDDNSISHQGPYGFAEQVEDDLICLLQADSGEGFKDLAAEPGFYPR